MEVIDGQHRLLASKEAGSGVFYIILNGYSLKEVHTLNLNQKNWTKKDFMDGYADMGLEPYIKLREFVKKHEDFTFTDCISLCSNNSAQPNGSSGKFKTLNPELSTQEVFTEGNWKGKDFDLANEWAEKIRLIKPYYTNYNRSIFVLTMISLFKNENFDYSDFMHKLRLQPKALLDCANREQQKLLVEEIYNFKSRNKVNLRY